MHRVFEFLDLNIAGSNDKRMHGTCNCSMLLRINWAHFCVLFKLIHTRNILSNYTEETLTFL